MLYNVIINKNLYKDFDRESIYLAFYLKRNGAGEILLLNKIWKIPLELLIER